jgi:hypothetical protein
MSEQDPTLDGDPNLTTDDAIVAEVNDIITPEADKDREKVKAALIATKKELRDTKRRLKDVEPIAQRSRESRRASQARAADHRRHHQQPETARRSAPHLAGHQRDAGERAPPPIPTTIPTRPRWLRNSGSTAPTASRPTSNAAAASSRASIRGTASRPTNVCARSPGSP